MTEKYTIQENGYVQLEKDGILMVIPNDPANSDYQAYLKSLEEGTIS